MPVDQDVVYLKTQRILREDAEVRMDKDGLLTVVLNEIRVTVKIEPHPRSQAVLVRISAPVLLSLVETPDLNKYVAFHGHKWVFGRLGLTMREDGLCDLNVSHTLLGDFLDPAELKYVVHGIAGAVESLDESLQSQYGGVLPQSTA